MRICTTPCMVLRSMTEIEIYSKGESDGINIVLPSLLAIHAEIHPPSLE